MKIAGVVVLFNPGDDVLDNILSYIGQIDCLIAIDNSEEPSPGLAEKIGKIPKVDYIALRQNAGIGKALNIAAFRCLERGYDFLLTMDQDSKASADMVEKMLECLHGLETERIGIIAPFHLIRTAKMPQEKGCRQVLTTMTSGNLLNLAVFKVVGPFMEELFIDYVDHEYCLRLNKRGYKVLQANSALLEHSLGNIKVYNLWIRKFPVTHHSTFRRYFMTRNRFYIMNKYKSEFPKYYKSQLSAFFYELFGIIFFEKEKFKKITSVIKGYRDFRKGFRPDSNLCTYE